MPARRAIIPGILLLSPLCGAQELQQESASEHPATPAAVRSEKLRELGEQMLADAREVLRLLGGITDRTTADRATEPLRTKLKELDNKLHQLRKLPLTDAQDTQTIHGDMTELTHLSQAVLDIITRLQDVGAYGSRRLLDVFEEYKFGKDHASVLRADDMPHSQLYNQLTDEIEDALYTLRKICDDASARDGANTVEDLLHHIEHTRNMLTQLAAPNSDEQREALEPARTRLRHVADELRNVHDSLRSHDYFNEPRLKSLLERLMRSALP